MTSFRLRAVYPYRICIIDLYHELHGPRSSAQGLKAGEEATACKRVAWVCEAALDNGVVPWVVAEGESIANVRWDDGWVEH